MFKYNVILNQNIIPQCFYERTTSQVGCGYRDISTTSRAFLTLDRRFGPFVISPIQLKYTRVTSVITRFICDVLMLFHSLYYDRSFLTSFDSATGELQKKIKNKNLLTK